jgi:hypothetical protein
MHDEEIDLSDIYHSFQETKAYRLLKSFVDFVVLKKYSLLVFTLLGTALGFYLRHQQADEYKAQMVVKSHYFNNPVCEILVENMNTALVQGHDSVFIKHGLKLEELKKIKSIQFFYPNESVDSIRKIEPFHIEVTAFDNSVFAGAEKAIISILADNPLLNDFANNRKAKLEKEQQQVEKKVMELDSMQKLVYHYFSLVKPDNNAQTSVVDPAAIIKEKSAANIRLIEIASELKTRVDFAVFAGFQPKNEPEHKSYKLVLLISGLFFTIAAIALRLVGKK